MTALRRLTALTLVLVYALIVLGAWVRSTNSGLSCPDWPTCYGYWLLTPATFEALGVEGYSYFQVMLEWSHRLIAGVFVGPLILALAVLAFVRRRERAGLWPLGAALLLLLLVQASLGGLTVLDRNSPWSVALHLGTALLLFAGLWALYVKAAPAVVTRLAIPAQRKLGVLALGLALAAMIAAAMTAKSGASLACSTWPSCNGQWFPGLDDPLVRLHFAHRLLAALTGLAALALGLSSRASGRPGRGPALAAGGLAVIQILMGAVVILLEVRIWAAVVHQALGIALFALLALALWRILDAPRAGPAPLSSERSDVRLQGA